MLIDSHCHLDLPEFADKIVNTLSHCWELGIHRLLLPGLTISQFDTLLDLKRAYSHTSIKNQGMPFIDIALGRHPYYLARLNEAESKKQDEQMHALGRTYSNDIVAIGECGLDSSLDLPMSYQERIFAQHIRLANDLKKPLVLHHRQSHNELIRCLKQSKFNQGGIIHAFSGSQQIAETYIEMGFLLGVGGTITYDRAVKTRATIKAIDLSHLVLETDAPDMPLSGFQGQANSPEKIPLIASSLAELKEIDVADIARCTSENYRDMFNC